LTFAIGVGRVKLIFIRHATAIDRDSGIADARRYLTPEGRSYFRKTARTMRDQGVAPDLILTSPLLRAIQTADILAERLKYAGELVAADELEPGFHLPGLERLLASIGDAGEVCFVGHDPDLSHLVVTLLGLPHGFRFRKGTALSLAADPGHLRGAAAFKWLAAGKELITSRDQALGV
jgi:phosphohistidine phosphatase